MTASKSSACSEIVGNLTFLNIGGKTHLFRILLFGHKKRKKKTSNIVSQWEIILFSIDPVVKWVNLTHTTGIQDLSSIIIGSLIQLE